MKTFHNEEIYIKTDNFSDSIFKENTMFFDIETTGFFTGESDCLHDRLCKAH